MAWDATPTDWISSWAEDGTAASFDLADLSEELTAAEADAASGDTRYILWALLKHTVDWYNALATADRPAKMLISPASASLQSDGEMLWTFTFRFYNDIASQDVADES